MSNPNIHYRRQSIIDAGCIELGSRDPSKRWDVIAHGKFGTAIFVTMCLRRTGRWGWRVPWVEPWGDDGGGYLKPVIVPRRRSPANGGRTRWRSSTLIMIGVEDV